MSTYLQNVHIIETCTEKAVENVNISLSGRKCPCQRYIVLTSNSQLRFTINFIRTEITWLEVNWKLPLLIVHVTHKNLLGKRTGGIKLIWHGPNA